MAGEKNLLILVLVVVAGLFAFGYISPTGAGSIGGVPQPGESQTCTQPLGAAQVPSFSVVDADKPGTAITGWTTQVFFEDPNAPILASNNNQTTPGKSYTVYLAKSGYFGTADVRTADCVDINPDWGLFKMKTVDTSITEAVYNAGVSNAANTQTTNQTIGTAAAATVKIGLTPSALYKHLAGENNKYYAFINATNSTDWDLPQWNLRSFDGSNCAAYTGPQPTAITAGQVVKAFECTGDFSGVDTSEHVLELTMKANTGVDPDSQLLTFNYVGGDYYQNTVSGALETGPVKDSGAAIQTLQSVAVWVG